MLLQDSVKIVVCFVVSVLLLLDIIFKFRKGVLVENLRGWGLLSPVYLSIIGGVSIYISGLVSWVLLIVSAICSTTLAEFSNNVDKPGEDIQMKTYRILQSKQLMAYVLVFSELVCLGSLLHKFVGLFTTVLGAFL